MCPLLLLGFPCGDGLEGMSLGVGLGHPSIVPSREHLLKFHFHYSTVAAISCSHYIPQNLVLHGPSDVALKPCAPEPIGNALRFQGTLTPGMNHIVPSASAWRSHVSLRKNHVLSWDASYSCCCFNLVLTYPWGEKGKDRREALGPVIKR